MNLSNRSASTVLGTALVLIGIVSLITFVAIPPKNPIQVYTEAPVTILPLRKPLPKRIQIAAVIDLPVQEMPFGRSGWEVASDAASIASTSARPGEKGNIVMYSHNLKHLFGKLSQVKVGDIITITDTDTSVHTYTVNSRQVINPDQIDILRPTTSEILTLYTCSGLFDTKRLVIQATPNS